MARIGKIVTFDGSKETITQVILNGMAENTITDINWSFADNNTLHIYGEQADLTTLKAYANNLDAPFTFDIIGDAPAEPLPDTTPPPTQDEIDALAFFKTAFVTAMTNERQRLIDLIEVEYDLINTTPIPFAMRTDIKWFRGIL